MKKIILIALVVILGLLSIYWYNSLISSQEKAIASWANVESAYQRRNDLIGNLVKTVQGAADFEKSTLTAVIEARSKATSTNIDPTNITPEQITAFQEAQAGLSSALSRLLVTVERYPELKANQNFLELQSQLEGTENRINVARDRFNDSVYKYNKRRRTFPRVLFAGIFGFEKMEHFKADAEASKAPEVDFNFSN